MTVQVKAAQGAMRMKPTSSTAMRKETVFQPDQKTITSASTNAT